MFYQSTPLATDITSNNKLKWMQIQKTEEKYLMEIPKYYIDTVGLSCYTRTIEQPIAQKRSPEIKYI